jgi:hypothetical protein
MKIKTMIAEKIKAKESFALHANEVNGRPKQQSNPRQWGTAMMVFAATAASLRKT